MQDLCFCNGKFAVSRLDGFFSFSHDTANLRWTVRPWPAGGRRHFNRNAQSRPSRQKRWIGSPHFFAGRRFGVQTGRTDGQQLFTAAAGVSRGLTLSARIYPGDFTAPSGCSLTGHPVWSTCCMCFSDIRPPCTVSFEKAVLISLRSAGVS